MNDNQKINNLITQVYALIVCGHEGAANKILSILFDELLAIGNTLTTEKMNTLSQLLPIIFDAQQRRDFIYLADLLRFELSKIFITNLKSK